MGAFSGASKIMIIRHAEKPDTYGEIELNGVDELGVHCGKDGSEHLVTRGWQRAGALVTLFAPPWGPRGPVLATPGFLFAAFPGNDPEGKKDKGEPSKRPYETLLPLSAVLGSAPFNSSYQKPDYASMVKNALACPGVVLICWEHDDILLMKDQGISYEILKQTGTPLDAFKIPDKWPGSQYDVVWVFERPEGDGVITGFEIVYQQLLAGDQTQS